MTLTIPNPRLLRSCWLALLWTLAAACSKPERLVEFGSFERAKAAALEFGCIEVATTDRSDLPPQKNRPDYFKCERIVGPSCSCKVTLTLSRDMSDAPSAARHEGIRNLHIANVFCPRAIGTAIAYDLLSSVIAEPNRKDVAQFITHPSVDLLPATQVERYRRFGDVDLFTIWGPVRLNAESYATAEQAESLHIDVLPRGYKDVTHERPLRIVPWDSLIKHRACLPENFEKGTAQPRNAPQGG